MKKYAPQDPGKKAWNIALTISALVVVGSIMSFTTWQSTTTTIIPIWQYFVSLGIGLASFLFLLGFRKLSTSASTVIFTINLAAVLFADTVTNLALVKSGQGFEPFIGNKMVAFAIAILAPAPLAIGYLILAVCAAHPLMEYFVLIPEELRKNILSPEPWSSVLYAVIATAIYRHRTREAWYESAMVRAVKEKEAATDLARKFLAIRDLTNTPVQTINFTVALLRKQQPNASALADALQDSYNKLRELSEILATYEAEAKLDYDGIAFDPRKVLKRAPKDSG